MLTAFVSWLAFAPSPAVGTESAAVAIAYTDTLVVAAGAAGDPTVPTTASLVTRVDLLDEPGSSDLSELLGSVAGLQMARLGAWGASAVPSLRGSGAGQVRFFVDGMPLPAAQTGLAAFARVPLDRLAAVEVYRGVVPVGLGGVGGAGAINFITRAETDGVEATLQAGSFGESGVRLTAGGATAGNRLGGSVGLYAHRADNDFNFLDHNQTFHRTSDDTVRVRENAWVREHGVWGRGRWQVGRTLIRGSVGVTRRDGGRPGPLGYPSPNASVRYERRDGQVSLAWAGGLLRVDGSIGQNNEYLYHPVAGEIGFQPPGTTGTVGDDRNLRAAWSPQLVKGLLSLETGLDWRGEWQNETLSGATEPERSRRATSAFAALELDLLAGRLQVAPSWRWQHSRDNFPSALSVSPVENRRDDVSPSLGVVWTVSADRLFVEAHATRTVRVPTWIELFGHRGGIDGNATLGPEEIASADLAVTVRQMGPLSGRVAAFLAETDDKIVFVQNSQRTSKALNLGRTVARGMELEMAASLPRSLRLSGNLTVQRITDKGPDPAFSDNSLPFLPDVEAHGRLGGRWGDWHPWLAADYMSANFRDRYNTELNKAPARTRWHLGLSRDWYPAWLGTAGVLAVVGEIINLTDDAVYDVEGFPLPGRAWHLAISVRK